MKLTVVQLKALAWFLSGLVAAVAFVAWGWGVNWQFNRLSNYSFFPLVGLLAFSLMWIKYVMGFIRRRLGVEQGQLRQYYSLMNLLIVVALVLHPGLLIWQLWRDGFGLPPGSYLDNYVAHSLRWSAWLGTVVLIVFLVYEFRYKYRTRRWWRYVQYAADAGMIAIYFHGLALGSHLQPGWLRSLWYFYGVVLLIVLLDIYRSRLDSLWKLAYKKTHGSDA